MSNEKQETVADIVAEMMNESHAGDASCLEWVGSKIRGFADRIEAAHKREVADLRRRLKIAEDVRPVPASPNICDKANLVIREFEKVATRRPDGLTVIDCECSRLECAVEELKEALREASWEGKCRNIKKEKRGAK